MYEQQIDGIEKELEELEQAMNQEGADIEALQKEAADLKQQLEEFAKKQAEWKEEQAKWDAYQKEQEKQIEENAKKLNAAKKDDRFNPLLVGLILVGAAFVFKKK